MSKLIVVVGATGLQGTGVINYFTKHEPSYKIRGLTRKPTSEAAVALNERGVEVVQADLDDVESLKKAFVGANAIFAYTNFNDAGFSPAGFQKHLSGERTMRNAFDEEVAQGKNIADAAATVPELERLVWSSLPSVKKATKERLSKVLHFDTKGVVTDYMLSLPELKSKTSTVHLGVFADNLIRLPPARQFWGFRKYSEGHYGFEMPISGKTMMSFIDVPTDTGAYVSALLRAPGGSNVLAETERMSFKDYLQLWGSILGIDVSYKQISNEEYLQMEDPLNFAEDFLQAFLYFEDPGLGRGEPGLLTVEEFEKETGIDVPRSKIASQIKRDDWTDVLK